MSVAEMEQQVFTQPQPVIGQDVYWFQDGDFSRSPSPAKILRVDQYTVRLLIIDPSRPLQPQTGVRHIKDPALANPQLKLMGAWDFTDETKAIERRFLMLEERVAVLQRRANDASEKVKELDQYERYTDDDLKDMLRGRGIEPDGRWKRATLIEKLIEVTA